MAIRIGIVGCGAIANLHAASYQKLGDRVELVACCDVEKERADAFVERYGFKKSYSDEKQMLEECELDAVSVCTWNSQHKPCTMLALDAGVNVLCEKPMAMNTAEALEMEECARRNGKLLMIGFVRRHGNDAATALDFINKGYLGDIYCAKVSYLRRAGFPGNWFGDKSYSGGGPLIDIGTHALDLTLFLMNNYDVDYVCGTSFEKLGHTLDAKHQGQVNYRGEFDTWNNETYDVEDSAVGFIKMKNGATIVLRAAWAINMAEDYAANGEAYTMLAGTEGGLDTKEGRVRLNHVVAEYPTISWVGNKVRGFIPGFSQGPAPKSKEAEIWVKALKGEGELFVTADQAYVVTRILDAIYESNRTGKPVYFD